ncbi:MAG: TOBE domain-containing protein [Thauera sp.]|uniref:TOBE domain-containing protein n=1 Tax=Thauera sedimentorum TaxID=2767595 RepID=A0ABR9BCD9_9RHOO|nr:MULTISPECIES: TOBE domain-containing protein [Zoogloeaceae]MBC9073083.1 TOBE domain-containing protein [Thauera sedimentorum]MBD8504002.1 TOBE domain-containing protein [Thauera sedimentorum]MDX5408627.1 TOBE domain-containing protein [Thauera sp.]
MKVSARNVFRGKVAATRPGSVNAEVDIDLGGGDRLVAVVTLASLEDLGLAPGSEVIALVKAPWVMVLTDASGVKLSARNNLAGTISAVAVGAVNAEVTIALPGGTEVMAVITRDAVNELGLKPGVAATAVIKASHVVLGVPV